MIYGALRHHPKYKSLDYGWFTTLFDEVPEDDKSLIREKKARKYVAFDVLQKIPEAIRAARENLQGDEVKAAKFAHDELLIRWLTTLPWRQRNIRECRIGSPENANLYFAPLPQLVHLAKPKWVDDALKLNPQQCFWQFYFREDETKTGQAVRGILPRRIIPILEEYLTQHRARLVATPDPGTLFLNRDGVALGYQILTYHVGEIVFKHTGRRMNPHLFRDAFAYAWLESHPEDYLTLSKILWHSSVKYTLEVYGADFDESNGARSVDEWLSQ
jgi:integrase